MDFFVCVIVFWDKECFWEISIPDFRVEFLVFIDNEKMLSFPSQETNSRYFVDLKRITKLNFLLGFFWKFHN